MDLNDYWQENKRFLLCIGGGLLAFLIGKMIVSGLVDSDLQKALRTRSGYNNSLRDKPRHTNATKTTAENENVALKAAHEALAQTVKFQPRPGFSLDLSAGLATNQYLQALDRVREDVGVLRSRYRVNLPEGLGVDPPKTNSAEVIQRHLEALDLVDRALRCAIESGVKNVTKIRVDLDPAFNSRGGVGAIERTRVELTMISPAQAVSNMLALSQSDRFGQPLMLDSFEIKTARNKTEEVKAEVAFLVVRLRELQSDSEEGI